jgi:hypothetical protein
MSIRFPSPGVREWQFLWRWLSDFMGVSDDRFRKRLHSCARTSPWMLDDQQEQIIMATQRHFSVHLSVYQWRKLLQTALLIKHPLFLCHSPDASHRVADANQALISQISHTFACVGRLPGRTGPGERAHEFTFEISIAEPRSLLSLQCLEKSRIVSDWSPP